MRRERVTAEALRGIGYDVESRVLEIGLVGGTVYRYSVPWSVHVGLMTAGSHGEYSAMHIRDAGFDHKQVE